MSSDPYLLPNGRVLRYSFRERLIHWLTGIPYVYLLLTGLAFWSPWLFWIAIVLGGATISRELHPWVGLVFVVGVSLMYRMWHRQMRETPADKAWWASIWALHSQRRRSGALRRPLQPWSETAVLGLLLERHRASTFRLDSVVSPVHSVELAFPPSSGRVHTPGVRAGHHRAFYHSRLHGHGNGARRVWLRDSRRRLASLG